MTSFGHFFFCIWVYWTLIESLTQFDEIFKKISDLCMLRILLITFSKDHMD